MPLYSLVGQLRLNLRVELFVSSNWQISIEMSLKIFDYEEAAFVELR